MKPLKHTTIAFACLLIYACANNNENRMSDYSPEAVVETSNAEAPASATETYISSSAATEIPSDTGRKIIRTADMKFKVKDVIKATYEIENIIIKNNGFVENANLTSQINQIKETQTNQDSAIVTTYYTIVNSFVLRVPSARLDTTLKEIAQFVEFLDYRNIQAVDVSLNLLSKKLEQARLNKYDERLSNAIDNKGKKLEEIGDAEGNLLNKQMQADEAKLANLQILDQIKFSTIRLSMYQNQSIKYEKIAKEIKLAPYKVPFNERFVESIKNSWIMIVEIFLFLLNIWTLILAAAIVFFTIKYIKKKRM